MSEEVVCKKKQLEIKIENLAKDFFAIDKDDSSLSRKRNRLKTELWTKMYEYYKLMYYAFIRSNNKKSDEIIDIITDKSLSCLENYKPESKTPFLHYANAAMKKEIKCKKVKFQIEISDIINDESGKGVSIFDLMESNLHNPEIDFESKESRAKTVKILKVIDECFLGRQDRVKKYLSALLTHKLFDVLSSLDKYKANVNFQFIDKKLFEELYHIQDPKDFPTQQDIASRFGKDKTDASRTLKKFFIDVEKSVNFVI